MPVLVMLPLRLEHLDHPLAWAAEGEAPRNRELTVSKIGSPGPLLLQLGAQALSLNRKERDRNGAPAPGGPDRGRSPTDIFESIAGGIARIPADLPDRKRRAFRIYLEALLARELRVEDSSGPAFQGLVDRVVSSMESEEAVRAAVERAGEMLLTRAR